MIEKISIIEKNLSSINAAKFQSLCFDFLIRRYPSLKNAEKYEYGKAKGSDKTKTGVPDIYFRLSNGQYVFAECSTGKESTFKKLKSDLESCFTTDISAEKLDIIHLCYTGKTISPDENKKLHDIAKSNGVPLNIIGLEEFKISLRFDFQPLAKEYLGIPIDSGQIIDDITFCTSNSNNKFTTGLDQNVVGRDEEINTIFQSLANNGSIIISGKPGVGKTKIGLEVCRRWCTLFPHYISKFISPKSGSIGDELHFHFHSDSNYILLVDDAFRIGDLNQLIWFFNDQKDRLKLILTVRDFAINKIIRVFGALDFLLPQVTEIKPLSDDFINSILIEKGIKNPNCHSKINKIARGNPRLALMAGEVALKQGVCDALNDVSEVYDLYFEPYIKNEKFNNEDLKALGIISIFKVIDRNDNELHENVNLAFGFTKNKLWDILIELNEKFELTEFDNINSPEFVKITDQTLASYVFYQVFFVKKQLSFSLVIKYFFKNHFGRIRDALSPILYSYGYEKISNLIKPLVDESIKLLDKEDTNLFYNFYTEFAFCQQSEIIGFLSEQLNLLPTISYKEEDFIINTNHYSRHEDFILLVKKLYRNPKSIILGSELILEYLSKKPSSFHEVVKFIEDDIYFHVDDYFDEYKVQISFFKNIFERINRKNNFSYIYHKLLLRIAGKFLQIIAKNIHERKSFEPSNFVNQYVSDKEAILELRKNIWQYTIDQVTEDFNAFENIFNTAIEIKATVKIYSNLLPKEAPFVVNLFNKYLNSDIFTHCKIVSKYFKFLSRCNISTVNHSEIRKKFITLTFRHYKILNIGYEDFSKLGKKKGNKKELKFHNYRFLYLKKKFINYNDEDYYTLIESYNHIQSNKFDTIIQHHFTIILNDLYERDEILFKKIIEFFLKLKNPSGYHNTKIIENILIFYQDNEEALWELIETYEFSAKSHWQLFYLFLLAEDKLTKTHYDRLLNSIAKISYWDLDDTYLLFKYEKISPNVIYEVTNILLGRAQKEELTLISHVFFEKYSYKLKKEINLLKKLYYYLNKNSQSGDFNAEGFKALYSIDKNFLFEYLESCYPKDYQDNGEIDRIKDFSFLWEEENYEELVAKMIEFSSNRTTFWLGLEPPIEALFSSKNSIVEKKATSLLLKLIDENLKNRNLIRTIFYIVVEYLQDQIIIFFRKFLLKNSSLEDFRMLPIRPSFVVYNSRSHLPILMKEISIWEKIKAILPEEIQFIAHMGYIDKNIYYLNKQIELEKKESFWRDY